MLITVLYTTYAAEARPYSLVLAFVAIALLCYQHAPSKPWMLLMGFSLAVAPALHYYAIFALVPFFLAEVLLVLRTRRLRVAVWLALACSPLPFCVFWPLLLKLKDALGTHFWAVATLPTVLATYGVLFNTTARLGVAVFAVSALGLLALTVALLRLERDDRTASTLLSEYVLVLGVLGLPFVVFVAARVTHGGMSTKYGFTAVLGIPLAMGFVLPRLGRRTVALVSVFIFVVLGVQEAMFWPSRRGPSSNGTASALHLENFIESAGYMDLPVVIPSDADYLQIEHYSSPEWRKRLFACVDPAESVAYIGYDSADKQWLALRLFVPLQVYDFKVFVSGHPRFLLYSGGGAQSDWWPVWLHREGYLLQVVNAEGKQRVYLVSAQRL
jgi:hypothetical protein